MIYILGLCDDGDVLSVFRIINMIIMIVKIVVPIILILIGMIRLMNTIKSGNEDLLSKAKKSLITNCIAAVIVFLIPTFVNVLSRISVSDGSGYLGCLNKATLENINQAYIAQAEELLTSSEENLNYNGYYSAVIVVSKIKDKELKQQYNEKLDAIYKLIEEELKERNRLEEELKKETPSTGGNSGDDSGGNSDGGNTGGDSGGGNTGGNGSTGDGSSFPTYRQCDSRWGNKSYNGTNLCNAGCGYTSLAMVLSGIKRDSSITPDTVHEYIYGNRISVNPGGGAITDAALYDSRVASHYGVKIEVLFGRNSVGKAEASNRIVNALNQGKKVVLLRPGHYIALSGSGSQIEVHDPAWYNKNGFYDINGVYNTFCCNSAGSCGFVYAVAYS